MSDEELSLRHRRASEAAAGAPSASVRAAVRREAEKQAALRRAATDASQAANDSHWPLRAVATLAVVAIAAGLWWRMRPDVYLEVPVVAIETSNTDAPGAASSPPSAVAKLSQPLPEQERRAMADSGGVTTSANAAKPNAAKRKEVAAADSSVARVAVEPARLQVNELGAVAAQPRPAGASAAAQSSVAADNSDLLAAELARRFPDAWASTAPVDGLWLRLDSNGKVVEAGQQHGDAVREQVAAEHLEVLNSRGALLRVNILRK